MQGKTLGFSFAISSSGSTVSSTEASGGNRTNVPRQVSQHPAPAAQQFAALFLGPSLLCSLRSSSVSRPLLDSQGTRSVSFELLACARYMLVAVIVVGVPVLVARRDLGERAVWQWPREMGRSLRHSCPHQLCRQLQCRSRHRALSVFSPASAMRPPDFCAGPGVGHIALCFGGRGAASRLSRLWEGLSASAALGAQQCRVLLHSAVPTWGWLARTSLDPFT